MISERTVGFEPADELAKDRESVRRRFWIKLKRVVAKLPFAEDLLSAYYCAFDKETPRHVQAALLGAIAYFILPFDFIRTCCRCSVLPTMPPCSPPRCGWSRPTSRPNIAPPPAPR